MAEEGSVYDSEGLNKQLQCLLGRYTSDELRVDSGPFCSDFSKLVEQYASWWQVPLPQLRILEIALSYFAQASTFFTSNCDHVLHTLSSLALSFFELLLFFDQKDYDQEPLNKITVTFQECYLVLSKQENVHLHQVVRLVQGGGPWASPALQAILSESSLPQHEVDECISSELPVFFELRVRYLLSCQRVREAMALAKCCSRHPTAGQHLFFLQVYLTWLYKTSQHDYLHKEVADLNGRVAVQMICSLECEEKDELLLALCTASLSQQLCRGDMFFLCDLVLLWMKLHNRLNTSKQRLLEESRRLMLSATNVNSIFPFIRAILQEVGEAGLQFCVELCANGLESCPPCDVTTKSLIYKTIAGLLPDDQEVCRACALLVFFLERTIDSYKMVYLLYMQPDQEYHVDCSPVGNRVRFETLQILKKDLCFDPEFWNLIALRTNCLKLMREKGVSAALEEIMEDKWISKYCAKDSAFRSTKSRYQKGRRSTVQAAAEKRHHAKDVESGSKRLKLDPRKTQESRPVKGTLTEPMRRSFWQLDRLRNKEEHQRITRLSEKNPQKRRIRTPRWLLEDSGTLDRKTKSKKIKRNGLRHENHYHSSVIKRHETGQRKNNLKHKPALKSDSKEKENNKKHPEEFSLDCPKPAPAPKVILELSLPDNELMDTFTEDTCNRQRGIPQVLLYKPTVKLPDTSPSFKSAHGKEVVLRARDASMLVMQLHCYSRRQKGKGNVLKNHGSVSTITRSSMHGNPPKEQIKGLRENNATKTKRGKTSRTAAQTANSIPRESSIAEKLPQIFKPLNAKVKEVVISNVSSEEPAVEMKVTIASQSPVEDKVPTASIAEDVSKAEVSQIPAADRNKTKATDEIPPVSNNVSFVNTAVLDSGPSKSQQAAPEVVEGEPKPFSSQEEEEEKSQVVSKTASEQDATIVSEKDSKSHCENGTEALLSHTKQNSIADVSDLTLVTEMVTELSPEQLARDLERDKQQVPGICASEGSKRKPKTPHKIQTTSSCFVPEQEASVVGVEAKNEKKKAQGIGTIIPENSEFMKKRPESEESKLEFCCTFCNKVFLGSRVVTHSMIHYRKDECMFCGTTFKDDLLAMMHLSDHIEELKEAASKAVKGNKASDTKDVSTPKTSAKAESANMSSECRKRGRPRKSSVCIESVSLPPESRKLRSNDKPLVGELSQENQNAYEHLSSQTVVQKLNGHIRKRKEFKTLKKSEQAQQTDRKISQEREAGGALNHRLKENRDRETDFNVTVLQEDKRSSSLREVSLKKNLQVLNTKAKQNGKTAEEGNKPPEEKLCCPVNGCLWFTDLSKNRVALLYHALDHHCGEIKPLEVAFRIGNNKCSICTRVVLSFEHFQHHVESHRLAPRYPCLHKGCGARFKSGIEMRRHTRKHSPLQAVCCYPGCSQLFICLWALNLHERKHYGPKSKQPHKNRTLKTVQKHSDVAVKNKKHNGTIKDADAPSVASTNVNLRAAPKLREKTACESKKEKQKSAGASLKRQLEEKNDSKDPNVLKNLSNKDTSTQDSAAPNLKLKQKMRNVTNSAAAPPKFHKVISSSLPKHSKKVKHKLKTRQSQTNPKCLKKRGRPPKNRVKHEENTTTGPNKEPARDKQSMQEDQKSPNELPPPESVDIAIASNASTKDGKTKDKVKTARISTEKAKPKKSAGKSSHISQKETSQKNLNLPEFKTHQFEATKNRKKLKVPSCRAQSDVNLARKHKIANSKVSKKAVKKNHPNPIISPILEKPVLSDSVVKPVEATVIDVKEDGSSQDVGKAKVENSEVPVHSPDALSKSDHIQNVKKKVKEGKKAASSKSQKKPVDKKVSKKSAKEKQPCKRSKCEVQRQDGENRETPPATNKLEKEGNGLLEKSDISENSVTNVESKNNPSIIVDSQNKTQMKPKEKKLKKSKAEKKTKSDPSKASQKDKNIDQKDGEIVKKRQKNPSKSSKKPGNSLMKVTSKGTASETADGSSYAALKSEVMSQDLSFSLCKDTMDKYSKKPYCRPPPTAYLDEKYTTMPKRRKEMSFSPSSPTYSPPKLLSSPSPAAAPQRQRCANCFTTFTRAEELQTHLQLRKCSKLFGFDSDDEDSAPVITVKNKPTVASNKIDRRVHLEAREWIVPQKFKCSVSDSENADRRLKGFYRHVRACCCMCLFRNVWDEQPASEDEE